MLRALSLATLSLLIPCVASAQALSVLHIKVVRIDEACAILASAEKKMAASTAPAGAPLPVEPARPFPVDALKSGAQPLAGDLSPYMTSSSDFDIAFITPVLTYGAQQRPEQTASARDPLSDFGSWSSCVTDVPPVLLIRVMPKLVEGCWTTVARGAAMTQGIAVPSIKRFKSGFSRLRALCGEHEVTA